MTMALYEALKVSGSFSRIWPHLVGVLCGLVIFGTGYFLGDIDRQDANGGRIGSTYLTAAKVGDLFGMARVGAARALSSDVHSVAAFFPSKVCEKSRSSEKISVASARLATISNSELNGRGLWSIIADEKGVNTIRNFGEICDALEALEHNGYTFFDEKSVILTDSKAVLNALSAQGVKPSYIAVGK